MRSFICTYLKICLSLSFLMITFEKGEAQNGIIWESIINATDFQRIAKNNKQELVFHRSRVSLGVYQSYSIDTNQVITEYPIVKLDKFLFDTDEGYFVFADTTLPNKVVLNYLDGFGNQITNQEYDLLETRTLEDVFVIKDSILIIQYEDWMSLFTLDGNLLWEHAIPNKGKLRIINDHIMICGFIRPHGIDFIDFKITGEINYEYFKEPLEQCADSETWVCETAFTPYYFDDNHYLILKSFLTRHWATTGYGSAEIFKIDLVDGEAELIELSRLDTLGEFLNHPGLIIDKNKNIHVMTSFPEFGHYAYEIDEDLVFNLSARGGILRNMELNNGELILPLTGGNMITLNPDNSFKNSQSVAESFKKVFNNDDGTYDLFGATEGILTAFKYDRDGNKIGEFIYDGVASGEIFKTDEGKYLVLNSGEQNSKVFYLNFEGGFEYIRLGPSNSVYCGNSPQTITNLAQCDNCSYLWSDGSEGEELNVQETGTYYLSITNSLGEMYIDSANIKFVTKPENLIYNVPDTLFCRDGNLDLDRPVNLDSTFTGFYSERFTDQPDSTIYFYNISSNEISGCHYRDTFHIAIYDSDNIQFEYDDCPYPTMIVSVESTDGNNFEYQWSDGSDENLLTAKKDTVYSVQVEKMNKGCFYEFRLNVNNRVVDANYEATTILQDPVKKLMRMKNEDILLIFQSQNSNIRIERYDTDWNLIWSKDQSISGQIDLDFNVQVLELNSESILCLINDGSNHEFILFDAEGSFTNSFSQDFEIPLHNAITNTRLDEIIVGGKHGIYTFDLTGQINDSIATMNRNYRQVIEKNGLVYVIYDDSSGRILARWNRLIMTTVRRYGDDEMLLYKINNELFLMTNSGFFSLSPTSIERINGATGLLNEDNIVDHYVYKNYLYILISDGQYLREIDITTRDRRLFIMSNNYDHFLVDDSYIFAVKNENQLDRRFVDLPVFPEAINPCFAIPRLYSQFSYSFSTGGNDFDFYNAAPGDYSVEITDSEGCISYHDFTIQQNLELELVAFNVPIGNRTDGVIGIQALNGVAPYQYNWSNGDTTPVIDNLSSGNYTVTVTDANSCEVVEEFALTTIRRLNSNIAFDRDFVLFPNPSPGPIIIFPRQMDLTNIQIFDAFGQLKFEKKDAFTEKIELDLSAYASGIYYVHLRSDEGIVTKKLILAR